MASETKPHKQRTIERIRAGGIVTRLMKHVKGELEMSSTQVQAARILLNKALPDLKAVEHSGEVSSKPVRAMTNDELSAELADARKILRAFGGSEAEKSGPDERGSVH